MYVVLVPVKPPAVGKSRLAGLGDDERRELAAAFALDTVEACRAADARSSEVLGDHRRRGVRRRAGRASAARHDPRRHQRRPQRHPAPGRGGGAAALAAARAGRARSATCPRLRAEPTSTRRSAQRRAPARPAYVADADGSGTTLYTAAYDALRRRGSAPGSARGARRPGARAIRGAAARAAPRRRRPRRTSSDALGSRRRPADAPTGRLPGGETARSGT